MKPIEQVKIGLSSYKTALSLIFRRGYIKFLLFPLLLNIIFFIGGWELIISWADMAQKAFSQWLNFNDATFWGAGVLKVFVNNVVGILIKVLFFIIFAYTSGFVILIVLSPVFSILSEKTEKEILNLDLDYPFNLKQILKDVFRGIVLAIKNLTIETVFMILMFILGFIPIIGWITPVIMFFISSYFFGFSFMDYTNERRKRTPNQSSIFVKKYKWTAITVGTLYSLSIFIPFCGALLSPFFAVVSVIAGTISMLEIERNEQVLLSTHNNQ